MEENARISDTQQFIKPEDRVKIQILTDHSAVVTAIEGYRILKSQSGSAPTFYIKARLGSLFFYIKAMIRKDMEDEEFKNLVEKINSNDINKVLSAFNQITYWLYEKGITKIDNKRGFD